GSAREVLLRELVALERACRERYGLAIRPEQPTELGAGVEARSLPPTHRLPSGTHVPAGRPTGWPSIPGLEMVDFLGGGGVGVVYKARQARVDRDVAVKSPRDPHLGGPGQRERFPQEAGAIARPRPPHLVQVYGFGEVPAAGRVTSQPYLVLEYISGG